MNDLLEAPLLPTADPVLVGASEEEWLATRKLGLGGSDIAALLGVSPYHSAASLYLDKRGEIEKMEEHETRLQRFGKAVEEPIRELFTEETGIDVVRLPPVTMYRNRDFPIAQYSPDGLTGTDGIFEAKSANEFTQEKWKDPETGEPRLPSYYEAQALWGLAVTGLEEVRFGVLIGGGIDFQTYTVRADPIVQQQLFDRAREFWAMVEAGIMPEVDGRKTTTQALQRRFVEVKPDSRVEGGERLRELMARWKEMADFATAANEAEEEVKNHIRLLLGNADLGLVNGVQFVTNRSQSRRTISVSEFERQFPKSEFPDLHEKLVKQSEPFRKLNRTAAKKAAPTRKDPQ